MLMKLNELTLSGMTLHSMSTKTDGAISGPTDSWQLVALNEILEELRKLNTLMHCHNTIDIPHILRRIAKNTTRPRKRKAKGKVR